MFFNISISIWDYMNKYDRRLLLCLFSVMIGFLYLIYITLVDVFGLQDIIWSNHRNVICLILTVAMIGSVWYGLIRDLVKNDSEWHIVRISSRVNLNPNYFYLHQVRTRVLTWWYPTLSENRSHSSGKPSMLPSLAHPRWWYHRQGQRKISSEIRLTNWKPFIDKGPVLKNVKYRTVDGLVV